MNLSNGRYHLALSLFLLLLLTIPNTAYVLTGDLDGDDYVNFVDLIALVH